jgi:hypothetical protein
MQHFVQANPQNKMYAMGFGSTVMASIRESNWIRRGFKASTPAAAAVVDIFAVPEPLLNNPFVSL